MNRVAALAASMLLFVVSCTSTVGDPTTTISDGSVDTTTATVVATTLLPPTTTTEPPDGFGGEVTIGTDPAPETLNPFDPNGFGSKLPGNAIWAGVFDVDPMTWERIPDTVVALPSQSDGIVVNDDGTMTVRYEVAAEAVWSDGVPITGQDVAFTAQAMRDMSRAQEWNVKDVMATVIGAEADGKIAFITFEEPTLAFEDALWIILPSHHLDGIDLVEDTDGSDWPSGGPFVVDEWDPSQRVRFVRNEHYWKLDGDGRSLPYLDALTILGTTEPGLQANQPAPPVGAFARQEIDIAVGSWSQEDVDRIEALDDDDATLQHVPIPVIEQLTFSFSDARFEANPDSANEFIDFRRVLASSISRPQLITDTGVPWLPDTPGMLIPRGTSAWSMYEVGITQIPELPEGATSILGTTCEGDSRYRIKDALEPSFMAAGVSYESECIDSSVFFGETIDEGSFDIGMWAWVSDGGYRSQLDLLEVFDPQSTPPDDPFGSGGNYGRWGDRTTANDNTERFSELVDEARTTIDAVRFNEIILEAELILATELPVIPLAFRQNTAGIWTDAVSGVVNNVWGSGITWNVELWQHPGE